MLRHITVTTNRNPQYYFRPSRELHIKAWGGFCWKIRHFVFLTFSLEPESLPIFFSKSNAVCIMSKWFKIMVVSFAYCVSLYSIHSPSIDLVWIPSIESESRMACAIGSAFMMHNKGDNESPCRMPLPTGKFLEITPFVIIALWAYLYNILIDFMKFCPKPNPSSTFNNHLVSTLSKAFSWSINRKQLFSSMPFSITSSSMCKHSWPWRPFIHPLGVSGLHELFHAWPFGAAWLVLW